MSLVKSNTILRFGLYLIILLPLLFTSFTFFPWHFGKTMIFQILVEVLVIVFLAYRLFCHSEQSHAGRRGVDEFIKSFTKFNFLDWSVIIFLAIITLTSLTGVNPTNSFWGNQARANGVFTWLHFGAFYFLLIFFFKNRKERAGFFLSIAILVAVLVSFTSLFPQILPSLWQAASGGGIIGNRAFLASYLILALGLSSYLFINYKNKWRWLFLAPIVLFFYAIINTGNRGALLGIAAGFFLGLALCLFFIRDKRIKIWLAASLIIICSLLFFVFLLRQNLFLQRHFSAVTALANTSLSEGTTQTRLMAWESAWQGIKAMPFQGWGWGNYGVVFDKYYNPQFLKHSFAETVWDKPHNWLLEIGVTAGILGVIGYLFILVCAVYYLWRCRDFGRDKKIILTSTLIAYFVTNLFLFETTNSLILWFLILAFVSAFVVIPVKAGMPGISKLLDSPSKTWNDKMRRFCVLLVILLIFYFLFLNFRLLKSSYYMRQAELSTALMDWTGFANQALGTRVPFLSEDAVFLAEQFTKFDKAGVIVKEKKVENVALKIVEILGEISDKYPNNLSFPVWAGQVYLVLGEKFDEKYYAEAERALLAAQVISPQKQEVLFLLGRLYLLKKNFDKALDFQKKAVAVAPGINISHWFLGLTYVAQGEHIKGLGEIEKAIELGYNLTKNQRLYVLDLYALEKNYSKLIEEYTKLIEEDAENVNWYIKLATVYAEAGDKQTAMGMTQRAINLYPPIKSEAEEFIKKYNLK